MAIAVISDLHSNIEALNAVLKDIESQGIKTIYCLGDLVGYGPNPAEVLDLAMGWPLVLMGNHDEGVLKEAYGFNPVARAAVTWSRELLRPGLLSSRQKKERWGLLSNLKLTHKEGDVFYVHGSPRDPTMEYILRSDCTSFTGDVPEKIADIFSRFEGSCFVGHTHDPGVITQDSVFRSPREVDDRWRLERGRKYVVNVGSVGQPRDGDTRACYVVHDGDTVFWRRVTYDYQVTMNKIYSIHELDRRAGDRLALGR